MAKTNELPSDVDSDELNAMIAALGREMGRPTAGVYPPDLVELDEIPGHIYGYNAGCRPSGVEQYKAGQEWRRRIIAELQRQPDWVREWRERQALNRRIRELCERKQLKFMPWEC